MHLVYYRKQVPNFGDDLNAELWPALAPRLFADEPGTASDIGFVGIGTIIGMPISGLQRLNVFSSGIGNDRPSRWRDLQVEYWCVRGPISTRVLDLPDDRAITDGAILTPLVAGFPRAASATGGTVIVPHWETMDHPGWSEVASLTGFELLDPRGDPKSVIERIAGATMVLTESLHGAILADTYGVPWRAFATSKNFGVTKWVDWAGSLGHDFSLTMVPPPDSGPVLAFGRPVAPFGETRKFDAATALAQFDQRLTHEPETLKSRLKAMVKQSPLVRRFLGFRPERTAEALDRLAQMEPELSTVSQRESLQQRMLSRLSALSVAAGHGPLK
ncbi:MAG: polysaccharide pyruvyl transferase family protein [Rhizobiaceae bacterium]|nr:polysaccharide pyruvyl transferase family protein [Rhizobiaceae bacterium]